MKLKVTLVSNSEGWDKMMNGQLETELACSDRVEVSGFVPCNNQKQREHAKALNIKLYDAQKLSGFTSPTELLSFPPEELEIDILIMHSYGHDVGRQAQVIAKAKQCKMVFVLHTVSEELERFIKNPASSTVAQQSEHELQVALCKKADLVIAVGPKVAEAYKAALQFCGKQDRVITLMPKFPEEFFGVRQQSSDSGNQNSDKKFRVLISASSKYFEVKGCDIAAKAFKLLNDPLYQLILVIQPKDDTTAIQQAMVTEGITANQLIVRKWSEDPATWHQWLCEADVVIKPSRTEGFGMSGLKAIAADVPVLISENCGLGMALKRLPTGAQHVVNSDLPQAWADKIKEVKQKDVNTRRRQAEQLRNEYTEKFNWDDQINALIEEFFKMVPPGNII